MDRGRWYGPFPVLATYTAITEGERVAGNRVLLVAHSRLWSCARTQLRPVSERERLIAERPGLPWTFEDLVESVDKGDHIDVSDEGLEMVTCRALDETGAYEFVAPVAVVPFD